MEVDLRRTGNPRLALELGQSGEGVPTMDNRSRVRRILWGTLRGIFLPQRALELMLRWEDAYSDLFDRDPIAVCTAFFRREMSHTLTEIQCIDLAEELITILERHSSSLPQDPIVSVHRLRASRARDLLPTPGAMNVIEDQSSPIPDINNSQGPVGGSRGGTQSFYVDAPTRPDAFVEDEVRRRPEFGRGRARRDANEFRQITPNGADDVPWMGDGASPSNSNLSIPTIPSLAREVPETHSSEERSVGLRPFANARAAHEPRKTTLNPEAPKQKPKRSELPKVETDPFYGLDRSTFARIFLEHE